MHRLAHDQLIGANFAFQRLAFEGVAEILQGFGFREMELWGVAPHLDLFHASETRDRSVHRALGEDGLAVWCFTPEQVVYPINIASGDEALRRDSIERFCRAVDIAAELGARYLFLTSGRGFEDEPPEAAWRRSAESLAEIAAHAVTGGLRCLLGPLQRVETNVVTSAADLQRMLDDVAADTMDVVLDTVGMAAAGDTVADYVQRFGARLTHVQIVDGTPAGHLVWGDGMLPLDEYFNELTGAGYAGKLTFEPFGNGSHALDPMATWARSLKAIEPHLDRSRGPA